ncbi:MAG: ATPase, T2SS/T4P/T4SS family [Actinomycetota bacterium]|nr:ATPase, T2SS/T4P/T4SS family [Actinomycetota bacterium]
MRGGCDRGLGDRLVEKGVLTPEQLDDALKSQKAAGLRLKDILVNRGYTTKKELWRFITENVDIPYVKLTTDLIDPQAVKMIPANVARNYAAIPVTMVGDILTIAVSCPFDTAALDMLAFASGYNLEPILSDEEDILMAIDYFFQQGGLEEDLVGWEEDRLEVVDRYSPDSIDGVKINEGPVVKLVNLLLSRAIKEGASDVHIEPEENLLRVRYRVDGVLVEAKILPLEVHNALVSRIKVLAELNIAEKRLPQDGRFFVRYGGKDVDFRVATAPTIYGESVIIRVLDQSNAGVNLEEVGFEDESLRKVMRALDEPYGFILVTGPTGSGKTTTQYAMLNQISDISKKVITIEDPVEYRLKLINQIPVNNKVGLDFSTVLRSVLRQDPDVILVGEIRDMETARIAVQAALTGHLLLSTLHTTGAPETLPRLVDMGIEPYYVREVVKIIVAQRLVRKLCPRCKEKYVPDPRTLAGLGLVEADEHVLYKPRGCKYCNQTGYKGRMGIFEVMPMTRELKAMMSLEVTPEEVKDEAVRQGMTTMREDALRKALAGATSLDELERAVPR